MYVADTFFKDGKQFAVCSGSDIRRGMQIRRIRLGQNEYAVRKAHFFESFMGEVQVGLEMATEKLIPTGEAEIIN